MEVTHGPQIAGTPTAAEFHHMCDKCFEIDKKIERYRRSDGRLAVEGIGKLVAEVALKKIGLHPPDRRAEADRMRFYFDLKVDAEEPSEDEEGLELEDAEAAQLEAAQLLSIYRDDPL